MSNIVFSTNDINVTLPETNEKGLVVAEIKVTHSDHVAQEQAYVAANTYKEQMMGALVTNLASAAKERFTNDAEANVVQANLPFGGTTIGTEVHREHRVGDEVMANHVMLYTGNCYDTLVEAAIEGIWDDAPETN